MSLPATADRLGGHQRSGCRSPGIAPLPVRRQRDRAPLCTRTSRNLHVGPGATGV